MFSLAVPVPAPAPAEEVNNPITVIKFTPQISRFQEEEENTDENVVDVAEQTLPLANDKKLSSAQIPIHIVDEKKADGSLSIANKQKLLSQKEQKHIPTGSTKFGLAAKSPPKNVTANNTTGDSKEYDKENVPPVTTTAASTMYIK